MNTSSEIPTDEPETTSTEREKPMRDIVSSTTTVSTSTSTATSSTTMTAPITTTTAIGKFDVSEYVGTHEKDDTMNDPAMYYSVAITPASGEEYNIVINISNSTGTRASRAEYTTKIDSNPLEFEAEDGWGTNYYKIEFDDEKMYLSCENIASGGGNWAIPKAERVEIPLS